MGVPSLVRFATAHCVGASCIVLVSRSLVSADCTCVLLIDLMAMNPAIVPQERLVATLCQSRCRAAAGVAPPLLCANASASFLLAAVSKVTEAVRARLAAVSC